jgi:nucleoside-triphosphatase THEP1
MNIAYTIAPGDGDTNLLLAAVATKLTDRGLSLCGTVQINSERPDDGPCDMDVLVLPDGPVIRISQNLGKGSQGCRLDPEALENAVGLATARLRGGADVLIVNKFGKHEADGRGFRDLIAEALALDIPVLVGTNTLNEPAFLTFSDGCAQRLPANGDALVDWFEAVLPPDRQLRQGHA